MSGPTRRGAAERRPTVAAHNGRRPARPALSMRDLHRARILAALAAILAEEGLEHATVSKVIRRARVPRTAFYQVFADRDDALRTLVGNGLERSRAHVLKRNDGAVGWQERTRTGLLALLALYEAEPDLARLCLIHSRHPEPGMARMRREIVEQLTEHIAGGAQEGRMPPSTLTAECTVLGVLASIETRLERQTQPRLTTLSRQLMSFIVVPYRGADEARAALARTPASPRSATRTDAAGDGRQANLRITYRTMRVLSAIASSPGLSNLAVAEEAGIADQGQISKLLKRLAATGLVENTGDGAELGSANAWQLTGQGRHIERSILGHHVPWRR